MNYEEKNDNRLVCCGRRDVGLLSVVR